MKIAIISDIHGNLEALTSIIDDIKKENIDEIICLGDTVGLGPNTHECLNLMIDNNVKMALGNHELYYLKGNEIDDEMSENEIKHHNWINSQIDEMQKEYLEKQKMFIEKEINGKKILFVHFLIDENSKDQYPFYDFNIINDSTINKIINKLDYDLIFIGHEHKAFNVDKLYDVGSSGCTKDNITWYTILDTNNFKITTKKVIYDRDKFYANLVKNNYPDRDKIAKYFYGIDEVK